MAGKSEPHNYVFSATENGKPHVPFLYILLSHMWKIYRVICAFKIFMTTGSLMKVESITECSPWIILQYF